jgi:heavy metal sensor kinase
MMALSLRVRLTIWFAASVLLILAPFLTGILILQWRSMHAALDHHLREDLEVATELLAERGGVIVWPMETRRDVGYDAGLQRWVEVYENGRPLFLRGVPAAGTIRSALPPPSAQSSGFRTVQIGADTRVRTLTLERQLGRGNVWIRVGRFEDELRRDLRRLVVLFLVGVPFCVLTASIAGYVVSGRALSPLGRMAERARSISADDLSERLPVENRFDELGQLAIVFNDTFRRLEASFERLKRFSADASHELRTPLTAIRSVGEVGLRETRDARGYQEIIGSMLEETDRLSRVVDTLLMLSRWESGRVRPEPTAIDLRDVARTTAGQLAVLAEERNVTITFDLPRPLIVCADPMMSRQAVMNVVDNAIKFTRAGGRIRIWGQSALKEHSLVVDDDGPGIPVEHRSRVLERFYQIDDGVETSSPGSGLGLAIVQWAMTANRGRIWIDSNETGGARIVLTLPAAEFATSTV